jgi:iron complex outermembrane receptor protein
MAGINWRIGTLSSAYASVSRSFETPTTTELANRPEGVGGLNADLKPQRGTSYEVGYKGARLNGLIYDVALFTIITEDELIPFQVPGAQQGRQFFRNAGQTTRRGIEGSVAGVAGPVSLGMTGTWLRYVYDEFVVAGTSFNDNRVPGVAPVTLSAFVNHRSRWGMVALEGTRVGRVAANNANTAWADAYTLVNARFAYRAPTRLALEPAIGVDNIFDRTYASNVVVNAAAGRFYEPGAGRTFWFGVRMGTR